ncbi:hypothetical protein ACHAW6_000648 [Cyclotella cf. meneghiniana]
MLCYRRMPCNLYCDTLFCPKVPSARGYTMVQIFTTDFGWSRSYPMSHKSQAHDALGLLLAWEGVPPKMIVDGAKEMKLESLPGNARKLHATCRAPSLILHGLTPSSELKKGTARKLTWSGAPRQLWCFALKYKSYVHSHTAHDIFQLDAHAPKTAVSGETADISPFCELAFGIGLSLGRMVLLFLTTTWCLASTLVLVLMWGLR